jgi:hypothetical protein
MKYNPLIACAWFESCGLPRPVTEHKFHDDRKWKFDFAWVEQLVALEVEGGIWIVGRHNRPVGMLKDMEKYNAAAVLGWRVLRCQPKDLCTTDMALTVTKTLSRDSRTHGTNSLCSASS